MTMKKTIFASLLLITSPLHAAVINFDDPGISNLDVITNFYTGVTFNGLDNNFPIGPGAYPASLTVPITSQDTIAWRAPSGTSQPNIAVGVTSGGVNDGAILMTFDNLISYLSLVGLDFGINSGDSEEITLTAYDSAGDLIGQNHFTTKLPGYADAIFGEIAFDGMKYVAFNYTNTDHGFYGIDDLRYTSVVPLPAAFWLFTTGLIGLTGLARRKTP